MIRNAAPYLLAGALALGGCFFVWDPPQPSILIHNRTDSTVYVYQTCADSLEHRPALSLYQYFPDGPGGELTAFAPEYRIPAHATAELRGLRRGRSVACDDRKARFFFISEGDMRERSWEAIVASQTYERRVAVPQEKLREDRWAVTYGP